MPRILIIRADNQPVPAGGEAGMVVRQAPHLPPDLSSAHDWVLADLAVLAAGQAARTEDFDAVCVCDFGDFGANALRSVLDIPVVAAGRTAMLYALTLGSRFAILAPQSRYQRAKKLVQEYGLAGQCAAVRAFVGTQSDDELLEIAQRCVTEDGADVVCLGGGLSPGQAARLTQALPVPLIDPEPLSVKLAESFLGLGLTHSRRTYPIPLVRKAELIDLLASVEDKS